MKTRKQLHERLKAYAKAVRDKDSIAVSELFALSFDHKVHGVGKDPENP